MIQKYESMPITLIMPPDFSEKQFRALVGLNKEVRIERDRQGKLVIMSPTFGGTSDRNSEIIFQLRLWSNQTGRGKVLESSGGFRLPNGALRSPDASWLSDNQVKSLSAEDWEDFLPFCPEFVIELRSRSDRLNLLQEKMIEYLSNGAKLAWLIDPYESNLHIYQAEGIKVLNKPPNISASPLLEGFSLSLARIWLK